jgi:predicted GIY-YIG superfamily endonuclease
MYFVDILACLETRRSYVGKTDNLDRRFRAHQEEGPTRTACERLSRPVVLYRELHATRADAMRKERCLKSGAGHRLKQNIVADRLWWF